VKTDKFEKLNLFIVQLLNFECFLFDKHKHILIRISCKLFLFLFSLICKLQRYKFLFLLETSFFLDGGAEQFSLSSTFRGKRICLIFKCQQNGADNLCKTLVETQPTLHNNNNKSPVLTTSCQKSEISQRCVFDFRTASVRRFLILFWSM